MASYDGLMKKLDESRKEIAIFRNVILHAHSPGSFDWRAGNLDCINASGAWSKEETAFIEAIKPSKIDLLALTNHMKCEFACNLSQSNELNKPVVLPGMEVSFRPDPPWNTFRLHILTIFPEKCPLDKVCKIIPSELPGENKRTGKEEISRGELKAFIKDVHNCGGICIAAHIDTNRGVRRAFRQLGKNGIVFYNPDAPLSQEEQQQISDEFKNWILSAGFDGIEVSDSDDKKHYRWFQDDSDTNFSVAVLLTNDSHSVEDLLKVDRFTHIKMTTPGFDDLRKALQFPDTRIRFPKDLPATPSPRILGIQISAGGEKGFFKDLNLAFSDNLTCLIGPRGSGKSTLIEALRYVFGYNKTLGSIVDGEGLAKKVRELQEATLSDSVIKVVYAKSNGEINILEATYDPKQDYTTRVFTLDGDDTGISDVESSGQFPLRLFGWSEIEMLGREASRQRELLDRLVPELHNELQNREEKRNALTEQRETIETAITKIKGIFERNNTCIKRYSEFKTDFNRYNTEEIKMLFTESDDTNNKIAILNKIKENAQINSDRLDEISNMDLLNELDSLLSDKSIKVKEWWIAKKKEIGIADKEIEITGYISKVKEVLKEFSEKLELEISKADAELKEKDSAIREKISEKRTEKAMADLRRTAGDRLKRVEEIKKEYNDEWKNLITLLDTLKTSSESLVKLQDEITGKRVKQKEQIEAKLNQFETAPMKISIEFKAGQDRLAFKNFLDSSEFFTRELHGNFRQKEWPEKISQLLTPIEFALAILSNNSSELVRTVTIDSKSISIDGEMAQKIISTFCPFSRDEAAQVDIVDGDKLKKILKLTEVEWDDLERVLLNNEPVERKSPGQRSSAMLPLIALAESAPLVIDQPEDNLDNQLIGEILVDILADLKEKRQIVVATHNPNIVVSGDAEQIVVLDALNDHEGVCNMSGSIDKEKIVNSVINIMEGGREAFLNRRRRYKLT